MKYFTFYEEYNLLVFRPKGVLNPSLINEYYEKLKMLGKDQCLKRLIDFSLLDKIDFGFEELIEIKEIRDEANKGYTKYAKKLFAIGMANMIKTLMEKEKYIIEIHNELIESSSFLKIPEELVKT